MKKHEAPNPEVVEALALIFGFHQGGGPLAKLSDVVLHMYPDLKDEGSISTTKPYRRIYKGLERAKRILRPFFGEWSEARLQHCSPEDAQIIRKLRQKYQGNYHSFVEHLTLFLSGSHGSIIRGSKL